MHKIIMIYNYTFFYILFNLKPYFSFLTLVEKSTTKKPTLLVYIQRIVGNNNRTTESIT